MDARAGPDDQGLDRDVPAVGLARTTDRTASRPATVVVPFSRTSRRVRPKVK